MSFRIIKGTFHVLGYSSDGDSIRFKADDPSNWSLLDGDQIKLNSNGHAQLRLEAIDTLETHYSCEHQTPDFSFGATEYLLKLIGIRNIILDSKNTDIISANDGVQGFIVSRLIEKHGRPVCFIFKELRNFRDGDDIYLNKIIVRKSINFKMLSSGYAYPIFYDSFFYNLRELFSDETKKARKAGKGLWSTDVTNKPFEITQLSDITENYILFPKLFRRLTSYIKEYGRFNAHEFIAYLKKKPEKVLILNFLHFTHFDNVVTVNKQGKIRLKYKPENLVFLD